MTNELEVPVQVQEYVQAQQTLTLATASPTGVPLAATLLYVNDGPTLYFWCRASAAVARQLAQNPVVAFTIDSYTDDLNQTQGIQGLGECTVILDGETIARVADLFGQKFPNLAPGSTMSISFFRIAPTEIQFIDNTQAAPSAPGMFGAEFHRERSYAVIQALPLRPADTIVAALGAKSVKAGEVVVRAGTPADKFFIIVSGEAELRAPRRREDGAVPRTAVRRSGDHARSAAGGDGHGDDRSRAAGARPRHVPRADQSGDGDHAGLRSGHPRAPERLVTAFTSRDFRSTVGAFATGVTVITTVGEQHGYGMTANAFSSVSLDPPLVLVCVIKPSEGCEQIQRNGCFAVNILHAAQEPLSRYFASRDRPRGRDAFAEVSHRVGSSGSPILDGVAAFLDCTLHASYPAGDHEIFIGEVLEVGLSEDTAPLVFHGGGYGVITPASA